MAATTEPEYVLFEQSGAVARITLNRPDKLNAINHEVGVQLFEAFARCLEGLAQQRPLLLILDDLHWASSAAIHWLESLARRAAQHSVLIVGTYREEEAPRAHPLRELRRRLQREGMLLHLTLARLSDQAVASLIERTAAFAHTADRAAFELAVTSVHALTGAVCQIAHTLTSLVMLPIQANFVGSNLASPNSGSVAMPRLTMPTTEPSFGAWL